MLIKPTLFICCFLVAITSYNNAEIAVQNYDEEYFSPDFYLHWESDVRLRNASADINIAARTSIGNKQSLPKIDSINYKLNTAGLPAGKPTRPIIDNRRRLTANPSGGANPSKQMPTPILNWIRRILQRFIGLLSRLFPNIFSTNSAMTTISITSVYCTHSTTQCVRRRRRDVINHIINHTAKEQPRRGFYIECYPAK